MVVFCSSRTGFQVGRQSFEARGALGLLLGCQLAFGDVSCTATRRSGHHPEKQLRLSTNQRRSVGEAHSYSMAHIVTAAPPPRMASATWPATGHSAWVAASQIAR